MPCGAQLPAFLDLKTGAVSDYTMGWGGRDGLPKGTWFVAGTGNVLSHGGDLYDLARPNDERFQEGRWNPDFKTMLYPGGRTRLDIDPTNQKDLGSFRQPVFADGVMYSDDGGEIVARRLAEARLEERSKSELSPQRRDDTYPDKWKANFASFGACLRSCSCTSRRVIIFTSAAKGPWRPCASLKAANSRKSFGRRSSMARRIACWPPTESCLS